MSFGALERHSYEHLLAATIPSEQVDGLKRIPF